MLEPATLLQIPLIQQHYDFLQVKIVCVRKTVLGGLRGLRFVGFPFHLCVQHESVVGREKREDRIIGGYLWGPSHLCVKRNQQLMDYERYKRDERREEIIIESYQSYHF